MDCSPPDFFVPGIFQAGVLEWVAISFSRGSSQPKDQTQVCHIAGRRFTLWAIKEGFHKNWLGSLAKRRLCLGPAGVIICTALSALSFWMSFFPGMRGYNMTRWRALWPGSLTPLILLKGWKGPVRWKKQLPVTSQESASALAVPLLRTLRGSSYLNPQFPEGSVISSIFTEGT